MSTDAQEKAALLAALYDDEGRLDKEKLRHAVYKDPDASAHASDNFNAYMELLGIGSIWNRGWEEYPGSAADGRKHTCAFVDFVFEQMEKDRASKGKEKKARKK